MSWFKKKEKFPLLPKEEQQIDPEEERDYLNSTQIWYVMRKWKIMDLNEGQMEYWFSIEHIGSPARYEIKVSKEFYDTVNWDLIDCPIIKLNYNKYKGEN